VPSHLQHPYLGRGVVLTSKHQKLHLIAPPFENELSIEMVELDLDTDQFGTFSGEKPRTLSQLETAVAKARLGMTHAGVSLGIASEGAIGADFLIPFLNSDIEILVFIDSELDLIISESYRSFDITAVSRTIMHGANLDELLLSADFPRHGLIVRTETNGKSKSIKGINEINSLYEAIDSLMRESNNGQVTVESDLRAHFSPSRRQNISRAAELLAARVASLCPSCNTPGWGRTSFTRGLSCSSCGLENIEAIRSEILGCNRCDFTAPGNLIAASLDPARCIECNP
jgi:hypothetical protein